MKIAINDEEKHLIKNTKEDFHCKHGVVKKEDFEKSSTETNTGKTFYLFTAQFIDLYEKIKRQAQIITLKDVGTIIAETGMGPSSVVVDAGSGSGALCCFLAHICKEVTSYEVREDHQAVALKNKETLGIKNLTLKLGDIKEGISEKDVDVLVLDMPDPWNALPTAEKCLKSGGFLIIYSPTVPQVMDTANKVREEHKGSLIFVKTIETIQREWEVDGRKVRPKSSYINHTGFLTFVRKI